MSTSTFGEPIDPNPQYLEPVGVAAGWPGSGGLGPAGSAPYEAPPGYRPYDGRDQSRADARPAEAVTSAVLSLGTAGLLLITGFIIIFAASSLSDNDIESSQRTTLFVLAGLLNVVCGALLIIGGVLLLARAGGARLTIIAGTVFSIVLGVFWLAQGQGQSGVVFWVVLFCGPTIVATILALTTRVTGWLKSAPTT
jgi:hypothetical protein